MTGCLPFLEPNFVAERGDVVLRVGGPSEGERFKIEPEGLASHSDDLWKIL